MNYLGIQLEICGAPMSLPKLVYNLVIQSCNRSYN
jgi:hypothetical protein